MTVSSEIDRSGPYAGNGVTTIFSYGFRILDEKHIAAIKTKFDGTETTLRIDADYIVSDVGDENGGQIALVAAPVVGESITFLRNVPFVQEVDLENQGPYFAETVESAFDLAVMRDQQLKEASDRFGGNISGLKAEIKNEEIARISADIQESNQRIVGDAANAQAIERESYARIAADQEIHVEIDSIIPAVSNFTARSEAAAASSETSSKRAQDLVEAATAGFTGFPDGHAYDYGYVTDGTTYFDRDYGFVTDPVTP
ncbi:hypothetical protein HB779_17345 [Phyllobacterium sp. 628]|uniref:hypothetical protein n=1 Tax=Phyllobacterium sp. 628 TaxID=2718938 RepID=UPI0016626826|nr:hypothetical protein [Phyllobacterium sp. 628]QND53456.1 hypothetical protein HB779_17345 [Phyllobacterium sp. 628]